MSGSALQTKPKSVLSVRRSYSGYQQYPVNTTMQQPVAAVRGATGPQGPQGPQGSGDMVAANNLSDLTNKSTARTNLGVPTGTSGAVLGFLNAANTWSAAQTFTANPSIGTGTATGTQSLKLNSAAGNIRQINWLTGGVNRWILDADATAETGNNIGSKLLAFAYNDDGTSAGALFTGERGSNRATGSGITGKGNPYFSTHAAGTYASSRAIVPGGQSGNWYNWNDTQPTYTLGPNPITTTNGSPNVVLAWAGHTYDTTTDVTISGATAVGGITLSGTYRIIATSASTITVKAGTNATSGATGGGSAVQITPSVYGIGRRLDYTVTNSAAGFSVASQQYLIINPSYYWSVASGVAGPQYQCEYSAVVGPSDNTQLNNWAVFGKELDIINRGADEGYAPYMNDTARLVGGMMVAPENLSVFGGNEGKNITNSFVVTQNRHPNSTGWSVRSYQGFTVQPNALVPVVADPTGHGGVGVDLFGAYVTLPFNPIATTSGSSVVTVTCNISVLNLTTSHGTPTAAYFPQAVTVNGVTISAGSHAISSLTQYTFQVTGTGTASATSSGGGSGLWVALNRDIPYAPLQVSGEWAHGTRYDQSIIDDGSAIVLGNAQYLGWRKADNSADVQTIRLNGNNILEFGVAHKSLSTTVSGLPVAATAGAGTRAFVTDATQTMTGGIGTVVAGGGANGVPVYSDGTNWRIG